MASEFATILTLLITFTFSGLFVGFMIHFLYNRIIIPKMWPYMVILEEAYNKQNLTHGTRGRVKTVKGVLVFQFKDRRYRHYTCPLPKDDAVKVTEKGRRFVRGFIVDQDVVVWVKDPLLSGLSKFDIKDYVKPWTREDRISHIHQTEIAEAHKKKGLSEILHETLPYATFIILIVVAFVFYPDIAAENRETQAAFSKQNLELTDKVIILATEMRKLAATMQGIETPTDDPAFLPEYEGGGQ